MRHQSLSPSLPEMNTLHFPQKWTDGDMRRNVIDEWHEGCDLRWKWFGRADSDCRLKWARGALYAVWNQHLLQENKHGDEHMLLLPLTVTWPIVCGEGQEKAVINAQISASSAKHSAMSLTDDAASLPFLLSVFPSSLRLGRGKDHTRRLYWSLLWSHLLKSAARTVQTYFSALNA